MARPRRYCSTTGHPPAQTRTFKSGCEAGGGGAGVRVPCTANAPARPPPPVGRPTVASIRRRKGESNPYGRRDPGPVMIPTQATRRMMVHFPEEGDIAALTHSLLTTGGTFSDQCSGGGQNPHLASVPYAKPVQACPFPVTSSSFKLSFSASPRGPARNRGRTPG